MNPLLIIQSIELVLAAAPKVAALAVDAKNWIAALFSHGVITKEQQDDIHAHVDAICAAALAGTPPPQWTAEADPT